MALTSLLIELGLNNASFHDNLNKSKASLDGFSNAVKKSGEGTKYSMMEARHSVMMLGEEFGVRMPRAVSTMIASMGPVGSIMAEAFPILGVIAFVEIIAKASEHLDKTAQAAAKFAAETQDATDKAGLAANALDLENLKLDDQIAKLTGGAEHNELAEQIDEVIKKAGELASALDKDVAKLDTVFKERPGVMAGLFNQWLYGRGANADQAIANAKENAQKAMLVLKGAQSAMETATTPQMKSEATEKYMKTIKETEGAFSRAGASIRSYGHGTAEAEEAAAALDLAVRDLKVTFEGLAGAEAQAGKEKTIKDLTAAMAINNEMAKEGAEATLQQMKALADFNEKILVAENSIQHMGSVELTAALDMKEYDNELKSAQKIQEELAGPLGQLAALQKELNRLVEDGYLTQKQADDYMKKKQQDLGMLAPPKDANAQWEGLEKEVSKVTDKMANDIASMVATGKGSFKELFQSLEQEIMKELMSAALKKLMAMLTKALGGDNSSSSSSGGGWAASFGGIFGGGKAAGGPVSPGVGYLVGEKGPEAFMPTVPGTIVPNSYAAPTSAVNVPPVNVHVYGATDPDTFRKASPQIASAMFQHLRAAAARNMAGG